MLSDGAFIKRWLLFDSHFVSNLVWLDKVRDKVREKVREKVAQPLDLSEVSDRA
jgi:hypothetical protein